MAEGYPVQRNKPHSPSSRCSLLGHRTFVADTGFCSSPTRMLQRAFSQALRSPFELRHPGPPGIFNRGLLPGTLRAAVSCSRPA